MPQLVLGPSVTDRMTEHALVGLARRADPESLALIRPFLLDEGLVSTRTLDHLKARDSVEMRAFMHDLLESSKNHQVVETAEAYLRTHQSR